MVSSNQVAQLVLVFWKVFTMRVLQTTDGAGLELPICTGPAPGTLASTSSSTDSQSPERPLQESSSNLHPSASAYDDATVSVPAPAAFGVSVRRIESEEPSTRRKSGHEPAPFGTTRHYVAQDRPLHVVVGGCALSSEGVCILGFRPDLHRVQGAVATWVKTGENPAAARRAGGKRGGMQGPCGCARHPL